MINANSPPLTATILPPSDFHEISRAEGPKRTYQDFWIGAIPVGSLGQSAAQRFDETAIAPNDRRASFGYRAGSEETTRCAAVNDISWCAANHGY
jgi:hypothetical protein